MEVHDRQRLTFYCIYGYGTLFADDHGKDVKATMLSGRYLTVEPGVVHRLESSSTSPLIVMQISCATDDDTTVLEKASRFYNPYDID